MSLQKVPLQLCCRLPSSTGRLQLGYSMGPLLKTVQVPLDGIPSLQHVCCTPQLALLGELTEGKWLSSPVQSQLPFSSDVKDGIQCPRAPIAVTSMVSWLRLGHRTKGLSTVIPWELQSSRTPGTFLTNILQYVLTSFFIVIVCKIIFWLEHY